MFYLTLRLVEGLSSCYPCTSFHNYTKMAEDNVQLPRVPESLLKRRKQAGANKIKAIKADVANKKKQAKKRRVVFKRAEKFVKEFRNKEQDAVRLSRLAKRSPNIDVPADPKLAFVIRIRGIDGMHPHPKKVLKLFKLSQINNGVFLKLNKTTLMMLKIVEPFVAWGVPSQKIIRELIYKRGYGRVQGKRVSLTDNAVIENELGSKDIICLEDLIHEITTIGPNFKHASNFFWPFKLSSPLGGWRQKLHHYNDGGDFGFRDTNIDALIKQMI